MTLTVDGAGVRLAYTEHGTGTPVLLIHGVASDARALLPVAEALAPRARAIAYDRRGYGDSGAPEPYDATTVSEQAEDAAALLEALDVDGAIVAGDGFGALVALDLLLRHGDRVSAGVLANPPLFAFVPEANEALSEQRAMLDEALREGGPARAVEAWLGGRVSGEALVRAQASPRGFFADLGGLSSLPITRGALRALSAEVVVLTHPMAPGRIVSAADALAGLLPHARREQGDDLAAAVGQLLDALS